MNSILSSHPGLSPKSRGSSKLPLLTRSDVAARITNGDLLLVYRSHVVNATPWAPYHPGGALALLHFVGRDATDEVDAYHSASALERMERLIIGRVEVDEDEGWKPLTPPIALGLVRHPDGIKGHWSREGMVTLGESTLQEGVFLDPSTAEMSSIPSSILERPLAANVVTLHPAQLEPSPTTLNRRQERIRSKAYQDLKRRVVEAGLFGRPGPLAGYGSDLLRYLSLGGAAFSLFFLWVRFSCVLTLIETFVERTDGSDRWRRRCSWGFSSIS